MFRIDEKLKRTIVEEQQLNDADELMGLGYLEIDKSDFTDEDEFNQLKRYVDVEIPELCKEITDVIFTHNYSWHTIQRMLNNARTAYDKLNNIFQESAEVTD